jgi:hypothetical protein
MLISRPLQLALLTLALVAAWAGWAAWELSAQRRALAAAKSRWGAAPVEHYRMVVRMVGWGGCTQDAEVRRERIVAVARNTCRFFSPRTVTGMFAEIERFMRLPEAGGGCRRGLPGRDCACYAPYRVGAEFDPARGYPTRVLISLDSYAPNRGHLHYWQHLLRHGREPLCGGPVEPPGRHLVVELFEPLP